MKTILLVLAAALALPGTARPQTVTCQQLGTFNYCSNGWSSQQLGGTTYYSGPGGRTGWSSQLGDTTTYSWQAPPRALPNPYSADPAPGTGRRPWR